MKKFLTILSVAVTGLTASAQDFHLSQYEAATLYLNPALTGVYPGEEADYRAYALYRSQWASLTKNPFSTAYLAYDQPYKKFGVGGYLISNKAGAGNFNTINFFGSGAYNIAKGNVHSLTAGLQLGILYKGFNASSYTFDSQYDAASGGFNSSLASNEEFDRTSIIRFDAGAGFFYKYIESGKRFHPFG